MLKLNWFLSKYSLVKFKRIGSTYLKYVAVCDDLPVPDSEHRNRYKIFETTTFRRFRSQMSGVAGVRTVFQTLTHFSSSMTTFFSFLELFRTLTLTKKIQILVEYVPNACSCVSGSCHSAQHLPAHIFNFISATAASSSRPKYFLRVEISSKCLGILKN